MRNIARSLLLGTLALSAAALGSCQGCPSRTGGGGATTIAKTKYTCSNGTVEVASETACGDRKHCEDLCQHSGGSGGSCASTEYFCSVAQP